MNVPREWRDERDLIMREENARLRQLLDDFQRGSLIIQRTSRHDLTRLQRKVAPDLMAGQTIAEVSSRHRLSRRCVTDLRTALRKQLGERLLPRQRAGRRPSAVPTPMERAVLDLDGKGWNLRKIADHLHISRNWACDLRRNGLQRAGNISATASKTSGEGIATAGCAVAAELVPHPAESKLRRARVVMSSAPTS